MSIKFILSGMVFDQGTEKRLSGTTIRMETPNQVLSTETNQNGEFTFPGIDEPDLLEGEETYIVSLYAFNKEGRQQEPSPCTISIVKGTESHFEEIKMVNRGPIRNGVGRLFLVCLILLLVASAYCYYNLHIPDTTKDRAAINPAIVNTLTESLVERITSDSVKVSVFQLKQDLIDSTDIAFITEELQQMEEGANELFKASQIDTVLQTLVLRNLEDVKQAVQRKNKEEVKEALGRFRAFVEEVPNFKPNWFWQSIPGVYVEILFWALFATLLRLIGNTSYYVSRNIFYRDSILHKSALLVTIPLIALLIVFVISFFKISVSIGESEFVLDLSNPYVSIILASLIGLAPWRSWEFMYGLADQLFNSLKKWIGLGKTDDEETEGEETSKDS